MTLNEFVEKVIRAVSGGVDTDESRYDRQWIGALIHDARAVIARNDYKANGLWNPSLYQFYYPTYEPFFQSGTCFSRFNIPTGFIGADPLRTGCMYIGSSNDMDGFNPFKASNFRIIRNRTYLNDLLAHPAMSPASGNYIGALVEGLVVEVYSKKTIKNLGVGGVWDDPSLLPDFTPTGNYPVHEDMIPLITTYIKESILNQTTVMPDDTISDSKDTMAQSMSQQVNKRLTR
jgi:hypothetical protein